MEILHKEIIEYEPFTIYLNNDNRIEIIHDMKPCHIITPVMDKDGYLIFNAFLLGLAKPLGIIVKTLVEKGHKLKTLKELRDYN